MKYIRAIYYSWLPLAIFVVLSLLLIWDLGNIGLWMATTMSRSVLVILGIYSYSTVADMSYLTLVQRSRHCLNLNRWMRIEGVLMCWDMLVLWSIFSVVWASYTSNPYFTGTHESAGEEDLSIYEEGLRAIRSWGSIAPIGAGFMAVVATLYTAIEVREGLRRRKIGEYESTSSSRMSNSDGIASQLHYCCLVAPQRLFGIGEGRQLDQTDAYRSCQRFLPVTKVKLFLHLIMFILCMMFLGPLVSDVESSRDTQEIYG